MVVLLLSLHVSTPVCLGLPIFQAIHSHAQGRQGSMIATSHNCSTCLRRCAHRSFLVALYQSLDSLGEAIDIALQLGPATARWWHFGKLLHLPLQSLELTLGMSVLAL
jgi:hypothetical protein